MAVLDGSSVPPGAWPASIAPASIAPASIAPASIAPPPPRESDEEEIGRLMRRSRAEATRLMRQGLPLETAREGRFFYGNAPDAKDSRAGLAVVPDLPFLKAVVPQKTTLGIGISFMRRRGGINAIPTTS